MRPTALYLFAFLLLATACNTAQGTATSPPSLEPEDTPMPIATQQTTVTNAPTLMALDIVVTPFIAENIATATPACVGTPRTRLIVGNRAQVSPEDDTPLNVRSGPSTEFRILGRLTVLERFFVLEGPECGGEYVWYQVRSDDGLEGWIAEGIGNLYFVEPYPPG